MSKKIRVIDTSKRHKIIRLYNFNYRHYQREFDRSVLRFLGLSDNYGCNTISYRCEL